MNTATEPTWQFNIALFMALGNRTFRFLKQAGPQPNSDIYSGGTLPGAEPIDINTLINRVLSNFDLSLPSTIPDVRFDDVSGSITRTSTPDPQGKQPPTVSATYQFAASSTNLVNYPFGQHIPITAFNDFNLQIASSTASNNTCVFLNTTIAFDKSITFLSNGLQASVVLASNASVIGFEISNTLSTSQIIGQLLDVDIDPEVQNFLPNFEPLSATQPMRFYQASNTVTVTGATGSTTVYQQGFNVDQTVIEVLGYRFALVLNVHNGFTVGAGLSSLDLGIVVLNQPKHPNPSILNPGLGGPLIQVMNQATPKLTSITLDTELLFFGDVSLDLSAIYVSNTQTFMGTVQYNGSILGINNPSLQMAWSKQDGFQILSFPLPAGQLAQFIDFAKEIKQLFNADAGGCQQLADFTFSKVITTSFKVNVKPGSANGKPQLAIGGTYTIYVAGYEIDDIVFSPINVPITIPKGFDDIGNAILNTLQDSATALVQALYDNRASLIKFLGAIALQTGAQQAASSFICRFGKQDLQNLVDDAAGAAADAAAAGAAAGMDTLAAAAAVFTAATAALSFFAKIADCLSGDQQRERDQAKKNRQAAQDKINALLQIDNLNLSCQYANNQLSLIANWSQVQEPNNSTLDITITGSQGNVVYQHTGLSGGMTSLTVSITASDTYNIAINGEYVYQGMDFTGNTASTSVAVPRLVLNTPTVNYASQQNQITVDWSAAVPISIPGVLLPVNATQYQVQLWDSTLNQAVPGMSAVILATQPLHINFNLLPTTQPYFWPQPAHHYAIALTALTSNAAFNSVVSMTPLPPIAGGVGHTLIGMTFKIS